MIQTLPTWAIGLADHLWQATLFAIVAGLLTLALRQYRAQIRYWVWLAASLKFLVPFAALVALGHQFGWRSADSLAPSWPSLTFAVDTVSQPFSRSDLGITATASPVSAPIDVALVITFAVLAVWVGGSLLILANWWSRWRRVAAVVRSGTRIESGREFEALHRIERTGGVTRAIALVSANTALEPGAFGLFTPVLLWPRGISERLTDGQIDAILAHEVCHVRRRDNLAAALHMIVEAVFWFHPVAWWIGARLVDERERACDEAVLRWGSEPQTYAEGILRACQFYVESPLPCMPGVTGSDLQKRIERIMTGVGSSPLRGWRRLSLMAAGLAALAGPILLGAINAPPLQAQSPTASQNGTAANPTFDVASIKPNKSGTAGVRMMVQPGGRFMATNVNLRMLVRDAYQLQNFQLTGGPAWLESDHFDIVARTDAAISDPFMADQRPGAAPLQLMIRALLLERFKLVVHTESRELPIYELVLARDDRRMGPQLTRSTTDCRERGDAAPDVSPAGRMLCGLRMGPGNLSAGSVTLGQLAKSLSGWVGRTVLDRTDLTGTFDADLTWTPSQSPPGAKLASVETSPFAAPVDPNGPSIFTALQEQLGLKLQPVNGPVDVLVVDSAEHPTED